MKTVACLLVVLFVLMGAWWLWVVRGHESRTWGRRVDARVVSAAHQGRLLYSTGYRHENRHVFECEPGDVLEVSQGGVAMHLVDFENEVQAIHFAERIRPLMDGCIQPPVDWPHAVVRHGDGAGLMSQTYTVKVGGRFFVVLDMF